MRKAWKLSSAALGSALLLFAPISSAVHAQATVPEAASAAAEDEGALHLGKWRRTIEAELIANKFDDLDRMADGYRRDKTRLPGGGWQLTAFYEALDAPRQTDQDTVDHLAHLQQWVQARPESITARVALATSLVRWAWVARGHSMADKVGSQQWPLFYQRIAQAKQVLDAAANLHGICPQWYLEEFQVGLAQGWDQKRMQDLLDRGIQFEPDYFNLYRAYANYLLPKWYGHPGDASDFAASSADRLSGDRGDMLYFVIATVLVKRGDGDFPLHQLDWARIQRGYAAIGASYGTSPRADNQLAFMAYRYKDAAVAKQQFVKVGDKWSKTVWRSRESFDRARDWAQGRLTYQPGTPADAGADTTYE